MLTADSRAAAEVLTSGDPDVIDPAAGLLLRTTRTWRRVSDSVRGGRERIRDRFGETTGQWPILGTVVTRYRRIMDEAYRQQAALASAGAAFWLIISVFPATVAAVNVFGLLFEPSQVVSGIYGSTDRLSGAFGRDVSRQMEAVAAANSRVLSIGLIVSVALSLWSMSAGLAALTRASRQAFGLRPLTFLELRRRSYLASIVVVLMLGGAVVLSLLEARLAELADRMWLGWVLLPVDLVLAVTVVAFSVTALYRLAIGKRIRWRPLVPGVVFATAGLLLVGIGYSLFVDLFTERYSAVYGAVAGTILALLLAYAAVYIVVLGAIVNAQHLADLRAHSESGPAIPAARDGHEPATTAPPTAPSSTAPSHDRE